MERKIGRVKIIMEQKNEDKTTIQGIDLIEKLGLKNLPVAQQEKLIEEMSEVVYKRIILKVIDKLIDEEVEELNNLFGKGDMEAVDNYLRDKVPNFVFILEGEIKKYGDEIAKRVEGEGKEEAEKISEGNGEEDEKRMKELKRELEE